MPRHFDNWINGYLDFTSQLEAPAEFHFWTAVSTLAGALRGKTWFNMGHFKWKPNFFIVFVAPPGIANKSTTSGIGMSLLRQVQGVHFGPDSVTWQALTQSFEENVEETIINGKAVKMSNLTIAASELGTFLDMNNREMIDVLVDLWDGREVPWTRRTRAGGETIIPNPWVNLIAGTTPSWISNNMPEYAIGGGFTSRTLFIYADKKDKLVAYPSELMSADWQEHKEKLVQDLRRVASFKGEFRLTREAYDAGKQWYHEHWTRMPAHLQDDRLSGYAARKQTHLHKLCMILSAAERDDMIITEAHFDKALALLSLIETNMSKVFNSISDDFGVKQLAIVLDALKRYHKIEKRVLFRHLASRINYQAFEAACNSIVLGGYAKQTQIGNDIYLILDKASLPVASQDGKSSQT